MRRPWISSIPLVLAMASCLHVSVGPEEEFFNVDSVVDVYGNVDGLDGWDGNFLDLGLFTDDKGYNDIFHIELGPLFGFGVGLVGTRVRVLPLQFGVGSLFYSARPRQQTVVETTTEEAETTTEKTAEQSTEKTAEPEAAAKTRQEFE